MPSARTLAAGAKVLAGADPVLAEIIAQQGRVTFPEPREPFRALVEAIFNQQLAAPAAEAIARRFLALYPDRLFPAPRDVLKTTEEELRGAGVSRQKAGYLKDLAAKFSDGTLNEQLLLTAPDAELEKALISVKGVGRWTADIFLMFTLQRLDVLPVDDLALRKAVQQAYKLKQMPLPAEVGERGERWRPYRTLASLYLWRDLGAKAKQRAPKATKNKGKRRSKR